ncbi:hypothetical protein BT96DRAFT_1012557 [Gymnopus androsaceus JB14]|uniref:Uncharacterized protein n=1 Tax=Gymnopus androsaceus JB14 TaxID=1447944 RepID=A0A6A4IK90_9AGAR|nr:hypothetical protein BT96DRAFT_1012557 [Gymnopus androsaceus JB14]
MHVIAVVFLLFSVLSGFLQLAWSIMRWYLLKRNSGINEIKETGEPSGRKLLNGIAVICGGSIAGLLAARVCHEFFERVVIIEPEGWLNGEDGMRRFSWEQEHKRTRVMQYQSLHGYQAFFYHGLEKLFPDLEEQCRYSGIRLAT